MYFIEINVSKSKQLINYIQQLYKVTITFMYVIRLIIDNTSLLILVETKKVKGINIIL